MENQLLEQRIDSMNGLRDGEFKIKLINLTEEKPKKVYQVIFDKTTNNIIEHDVLDVIDGKTKYNPSTKTLVQSKRCVLATGFKVDIFNDDDSVDYYTYERKGKVYTLVSYYFTDREKANEKMKLMNYKRFLKEVA